ncbi:hypothetical protein pb186bvf_001625 [Paramecium bursaria]
MIFRLFNQNSLYKQFICQIFLFINFIMNHKQFLNNEKCHEVDHEQCDIIYFYKYMNCINRKLCHKFFESGFHQKHYNFTLLVFKNLNSNIDVYGWFQNDHLNQIIELKRDAKNIINNINSLFEIIINEIRTKKQINHHIIECSLLFKQLSSRRYLYQEIEQVVQLILSNQIKYNQIDSSRYQIDRTEKYDKKELQLKQNAEEFQVAQQSIGQIKISHLQMKLKHMNMILK